MRVLRCLFYWTMIFGVESIAGGFTIGEEALIP